MKIFYNFYLIFALIKSASCLDCWTCDAKSYKGCRETGFLQTCNGGDAVSLKWLNIYLKIVNHGSLQMKQKNPGRF